MPLPTLIRGDTFGPYTSAAAIDSNGVVVDISGATVYFTVKSSTALADVNAEFQKSWVAPSDATSVAGKAILSLDSGETQLTAAKYVYDIQISLSGSPNTVYTIETGSLVYSQDVTLTDNGAVSVPPNGAIPTLVAAASYALADTDRVVLIDASSNSINITLPAASGGYRSTWFKRIDNSGNTVSITADGSDTIDGGAVLFFASQYEAAVLLSDLSDWHVF